MRYVLSGGENETQYLTASFNTGPVKIYSPEAQQPVLSSSGLQVASLRWDFIAGKGRVGEVVLGEAHLLAERDSQGEFALLRLFVGDEEDATPRDGAAANESTTASGIPFVIDALRTEAGSVELRDHAVKPAVTALFKDVQLSVKELSLARGAGPGKVSVEGRMGESPVRIDGTLQTDPFGSLLRISGSDLPLTAFEGYLRLIWDPLHRWRGALDGDVQLKLATRQESFEVKLNGKLDARGFTLGVKGAVGPPFKADRLSLDVAALNSHPSFWLDFRHVQLDGANFHVRRGRDGHFNLSPLWAEEDRRESRAQGAGAPATAANDFSEPPFVIRSAAAKNSSIEFVDAAVQPPFKTSLTEASVQLGKLGRQSGFTPLRFEATIAESARIELEGAVKFFEAPVEVKLDGVLRNYDLAYLNPYATEYISYEIERGRVTTEVEYKYNAGELAGENEIAIRQLRLGDRTGDEFEEKIGVSLRLAVALLQGADGSIRLTVPVSGNLDDPQFEFGAIVWRAVRNAVIKFLSAPLRLLGNIATLGGRITEIRIDPVEFEPGSAVLKPKGEKQVADLAGLLKDRPKLELALRGLAARDELDPLKRHLLRRRIEGTGEPYEAAIARLYRLATPSREDRQDLPNLRDMEDHLAERFVPPDHALEALAARRAALVEERLTALGVERNKLFVDSAVVDSPTGRVEIEFLT
jgi:outer membrane protein OmpA-like peptidoglycan-associated protein